MTKSRTITLELLREGPPHNQLLSPLTRYLAACENRPPESIRLTVEHRDFLRWQAGLTYAGKGPQGPSVGLGEEAFQAERRSAIDDASRAVTDVLGSIRALIAELACEPCEWRHIHLVVDASELGALPFELARAAPGLMVEGDRLFLQQSARVTISRQTRRVATSVVSWPSRPRILCIVADGDLPGDAHILALRKAIDPWIGWNDGDRSTDLGSDAEGASDIPLLAEQESLSTNRAREAAQMMTVLENPTLDAVSAAATRTCFTHVHVLAHGAPLPSSSAGQTLYGFAFRARDGGVDIVDGDRLEAALRHTRHSECAHPTVVSLATCAGADVSGAVLGPGGSAAHAIHSKGVPLVVASQFPLTRGASVIATEMLYRALLRGEDPRQAVHAIRRELLVAHPDTHDWASLVLYASLPNDLDDQLHRVRRFASRLSAETAVERLRVTLGNKPESDLLKLDPEDRLRKRLVADLNRLDHAVRVVRAWTDPNEPLRARIAGYRLVARLALRLWDVYRVRKSEGPISYALSRILNLTQKHDFSSGQLPISMFDPDALLRLAKDSYEAAFRLDRSQWEVWVQVVVLAWALHPAQLPESFFKDLLSARYMVDILVENASSGSDNAEQRALAAATGFEVELLAGFSGQPLTGEAKDLQEKFNDFVRAAAPVSESYRAHVLWRQLRRYVRWLEEHGIPPVVVRSYLKQLNALGVRRYWGPRT